MGFISYSAFFALSGFPYKTCLQKKETCLGLLGAGKTLFLVYKGLGYYIGFDIFRVSWHKFILELKAILQAN